MPSHTRQALARDFAAQDPLSPTARNLVRDAEDAAGPEVAATPALSASTRAALRRVGPEPKGHSARRKWRRRVAAVLGTAASEDGSSLSGAQAPRLAAATGSPQVLVCTDLAARGLDTVAARHVIQLDFAGDAVAHLHRSGRTGRLDRPGHVTCILGPRDVGLAAHVRAAALADPPGAGTGDGSNAGLAAVFSRGRSFRRKLKKRQQSLGQPDRPTQDDAARV